MQEYFIGTFRQDSELMCVSVMKNAIRLAGIYLIATWIGITLFASPSHETNSREQNVTSPLSSHIKLLESYNR
jgi:hypothetical protein